MGIIHVLPETVQNKIAAGEVIERPASVVKELAENSMDAGATLVEIELEEGGHRLIRVSDNGCGMDEDDLVASLERHATSKIRDVDDIFAIHTFGFRGEALPSIGSVSRLAIATGRGVDEDGHELIVEGGVIVRLTPAPPRKGTRIEVRDIFFNTPARRNFLKQPASEGTRTAEILTRLALGNPDIGFRFQNGDRMMLSVRPAQDQKARIGDIFGKQIADRLMPFAGEIAEGLSVRGYFAKPPYGCKTTKDIYVLVNRRWIRYYGLAKAVSDVFAGILPPREHPFAIINLDVDPAKVDVNVHPAKEEVRFEQERILISGVRHAIRLALSSLASVPTIATVQPTGSAARTREHDAPHVPASGAGESRREPAQRKFDMPATFARKPAEDFSTVDFSAVRETIRRRDAEPLPPAETPVGHISQHRVIGQVGGKYIIIDSPDGLLMVDPHALHERWNYDRLVEERKKGGQGKTLLLPVEMELSPTETASADEAAPALEEYGFAIQRTAPNRLAVTAVPSFIPPAQVEKLVRQILADVGEAGRTLDRAHETLLASLACRSSVLLGRTLPEEEMLSLLDRFFSQGQLPTCPHGRPTAIRIGWDELGRRFGR